MQRFTRQEQSIQETLIESEEREEREISEIIDKSNIKENDKQRILAYMKEEEFTGPLPPPVTLQQYEEVQAGFADKIMGMALKEQEHRHDIENKIVESQTSLNSGELKLIDASIKLKIRLQTFGFVLTFLLVIIGTICIFCNKNIGSIVTFILAIGSFAWTMFYGKKQPKTNNEKNE